MRRAREAEIHQIKLLDKQINHPNQMILANPILKTVRKQRDLIAINTFDETRHTCTPIPPEAYHILEFPHSLGPYVPSSGDLRCCDAAH